MDHYSVAVNPSLLHHRFELAPPGRLKSRAIPDRDKKTPEALIGLALALASGGSILEPAGIGSIRDRGSF
ncbi:hypothetical protein GRJ2_003244600 [Grus japonensis]|uniref:Uncharacterized protein n=1 Tax=Grus japonensis TaxID=30415 RepID=A0ABC9YE97_GRUJA